MRSGFENVECAGANPRVREKETTATHLVVNEGSEGQEIEEIREEPPDVGIPVFPQAFVVEAVHLCDLSRFVVSSQDGNAIAIAELHGHEQSDGLYGVVASVDIVTHEEVVGVWRVAADSEKL